VRRGHNAARFKGNFKVSAWAKSKKRKLSNGFIVRRKVNGEMRFTVMSKKPQGRNKK
jgi:hypothetical protein